MAYVEKMPDNGGEPSLARIVVDLDDDANELLHELMSRTGWDASELVSWALGAYWREMEGIVLPTPKTTEDIQAVVVESGGKDEAGRTEPDNGDYRRHFTPKQIASIERGLADVAAGRTYSHEEVMTELRSKYGW